MKLYHHPISQNCRRVLATIYENGRDDVELVQVDLMKGEHRMPEYLAKNPNGKVPLLEDGDFFLWESTPIMQYLSSDSPLWPPDKTRYDIIRWQCWGLAHWAPPIGKVVHERLVKKMMGQGAADEHVVEAALKDFDRFATVLDGHLAGRDYLVGETLTLADFSVASELTYAGPSGLPLDGYAEIRRWYAGIEALDSWKRSAPPTTAG